MKHLYQAVVIMLSGLLSSFCATSQSTIARPTIIASYGLPITTNKTTNILFPQNIVSVDRGSAAVLARKATGTEHILQVKAGSKDFPQTNLTVITSDGKLYSFEICYDPSPLNLNISFEKVGSKTFSKMEVLQQTATRLLQFTFPKCIRQNRNHGVQLELHPVSIQDEVLYFPITLTNYSNLSYSVQSLRFYVQGRKSSKRTAIQEVSLEPLSIHNNVQQVKGNSTEKMVVALPQFTILNGKRLYIEVIEQGGGRHLQLKVPGRKLLEAILLSQP